MRTASVLIVEDEVAMRRVLEDNFEYEGYRVQSTAEGDAGLKAALTGNPDLIVLDLMLPGVNGYEICRQVRAAGLDIPIIMLTAKGEESDVVLGLNLGADDYVTKPFRIKELLARANAFLRRRRSATPVIFQFGQWELDTSSHRVCREGCDLALTPKEYGLLQFFLQNAGRALTRQQILDSVWGNGVYVTSRSVDRCVTTLRAKLEAEDPQQRFIQTIRDVGYRFDV